jgi:tetratricopeptide (TPR) repeat protein
MAGETPANRAALVFAVATTVVPYPRMMPDQDVKKRLLETLAASHERERELEKLCDDALSPHPALWTAKDHLAHLAHWRRHAARVLTAAHAGTAAPRADDVDGVNADVYAANRQRPAAEVKEAARASYAELAAAIEDCSEEELSRPRKGRDGGVWEIVPPNGHVHLGEHLGFWHQASGDERAAEQAQLWSFHVNEAAFTDPRSLAFGTYNLACYYARLGRGTDALPHLRRSFELHPDLKQWARKDKDLDKIRNEPEMRALMG